MTTDLKTRLEKHRNKKAKEIFESRRGISVDEFTLKDIQYSYELGLIKQSLDELMPLVLMMAEALEFYANEINWEETRWNNMEARLEINKCVDDFCSTDENEKAFAGKRAREALSKLNEVVK